MYTVSDDVVWSLLYYTSNRPHTATKTNNTLVCSYALLNVFHLVVINYNDYNDSVDITLWFEVAGTLVLLHSTLPQCSYI